MPVAIIFCQPGRPRPKVGRAAATPPAALSSAMSSFSARAAGGAAVAGLPGTAVGVVSHQPLERRRRVQPSGRLVDASLAIRWSSVTWGPCGGVQPYRSSFSSLSAAKLPRPFDGFLRGSKGSLADLVGENHQGPREYQPIKVWSAMSQECGGHLHQ
jgi:hypothetical protein